MYVVFFFHDVLTCKYVCVDDDRIITWITLRCFIYDTIGENHAAYSLFSGSQSSMCIRIQQRAYKTIASPHSVSDLVGMGWS